MGAPQLTKDLQKRCFGSGVLMRIWQSLRKACAFVGKHSSDTKGLKPWARVHVRTACHSKQGIRLDENIEHVYNYSTESTCLNSLRPKPIKTRKAGPVGDVHDNRAKRNGIRASDGDPSSEFCLKQGERAACFDLTQTPVRWDRAAALCVTGIFTGRPIRSDNDNADNLRERGERICSSSHVAAVVASGTGRPCTGKVVSPKMPRRGGTKTYRTSLSPERDARTQGFREREPDIAEFSDELAEKGLGIRDVRRDGNCFFRAVSDQLYGTQEHHMALRGYACDYMDENEDELGAFLAEGEMDFASYVHSMRSDGVWAGNIEIQAISMVYEVNIRIHQSTKPSFDITNHEDPDTPAIHLSYHFGEHYASVRPLHQLHNNEPAAHAPLTHTPYGDDAQHVNVVDLGAGSRLRARSATERDEHGVQSEDTEERRERRRRRRERRRERREDEVTSTWERVERLYIDAVQRIEHAEAAARFFRRAPVVPDADDERYVTTVDPRHAQVVLALENVVAQASTRLNEVLDRVHAWKVAHAARTGSYSGTGGTSSGSVGASDGDRSADGQDGEFAVYGWDLRQDDHEYGRRIKRERRLLLDRLSEAGDGISKVLARASELREESVAGVSGMDDGAGGANGPVTPPKKVKRPSKKKEQEAKKRERKARRRMEQEREARAAAAASVSVTGRDYSASSAYRLPHIGIWAGFPEVTI